MEPLGAEGGERDTGQTWLPRTNEANRNDRLPRGLPVIEEWLRGSLHRIRNGMEPLLTNMPSQETHYGPGPIQARRVLRAQMLVKSATYASGDERRQCANPMLPTCRQTLSETTDLAGTSETLRQRLSSPCSWLTLAQSRTSGSTFESHMVHQKESAFAGFFCW